MEANGKACSRCEKFKSAREFYQKGRWLEAICKTCKREVRNERKNKSQSLARIETSLCPEIKPVEEFHGKSDTYLEYGLTQDHFMEIVEFYYELMKLEKKGG
ncbi:MAG: hypothetical protein ACOYOK_00080 [Pseudobdellovibrionaceae bacterium]